VFLGMYAHACKMVRTMKITKYTLPITHRHRPTNKTQMSLEHKIRSGGHGTVYSAVSEDGEAIAVKVARVSHGDTNREFTAVRTACRVTSGVRS
jgi:hypothetical protein